MTQATILVVEDEQPIRDMLRFALSGTGFRVEEAADAYEAEQWLGSQLPALILLDWMLPGVSGLDFARRLRREEATREIPIIMLTARVDEEHKIQGLDTGADDYITKPFSTRELIARIRAVLRRRGPDLDEVLLQAGELTVDTVSHRVTLQGQNLEIGPTEYRLLVFFMGH
ncbi:MAG: response regulator, partial [Candidatus Competibacterales bacterium]|nr:response regulator [Candidatus Competibacterales bacterium]